MDAWFTADAPGDRFVGDITYIQTSSGWLYLSTLIDLYNREVAGYDIASQMRASLVTDAIDLAATRGLIDHDAVFHSGRGSQYTSSDMVECRGSAF